MSNRALIVKRLRPDAVLPFRGTPDSVGYNLCLPTESESVFIHFGEPALIKLGFALVIPAGYYGRIAPHSDLVVKMGVGVMSEVIDAGNRGEICIVLVALKAQSLVKLEPGAAVAQLILERADVLPVVEGEIDRNVFCDSDAPGTSNSAAGKECCGEIAIIKKDRAAEWVTDIKDLY
jgi:dUTPase